MADTAEVIVESANGEPTSIEVPCRFIEKMLTLSSALEFNDPNESIPISPLVCRDPELFRKVIEYCEWVENNHNMNEQEKSIWLYQYLICMSFQKKIDMLKLLVFIDFNELLKIFTKHIAEYHIADKSVEELRELFNKRKWTKEEKAKFIEEHDYYKNKK